MKHVLPNFIVLAVLSVAPLSAWAQTEPEPAEPAPDVQDAPVVRDPLAAQDPAEAQAPAEAPPRQADLSAANSMVEVGAYAEAEAALAELQAEFPDDPRLLLMRGELLLALQRAEEAIPLLRRAIEIDPERPRTHFQFATALMGTGDPEGAIEAFAGEIELNEDPRVKVMAHVNRSMLLEQAGNWEGAAAELEAVLVLTPENLEIYGDLASLSLQAKQLEQAASYLENGFENGFRSAQHYYILGTRFYGKKAYQEAIAAFRKTLEINPNAALAERSLGAALDQIDQPEEAVSHLRRYLELDPEAADAGEVERRIREVEGG